MSEPDPAPLRFAPFCSTLDSGFWHKLSQNKLDVYGLDDQTRSIGGHYVNGDAPGLPSRVTLDFSSFDSPYKVPPRCFPCHGTLKNTNTIEEFRNIDKNAVLKEEGEKVWKDITSGASIADPSLLAPFFLLSHADLKKYHYYYWFAFPALRIPKAIHMAEQPRPIQAVFNEEQILSLQSFYDQNALPSNSGFFLLLECGDLVTVFPLMDFDRVNDMQGKMRFCMCDPCTLEQNPGWPLANFLTLISYHWSHKLVREIEIVCLRDRFKDGKRSVNHSIVLNITLSSIADEQECPKCVGWEKNEKQKYGPRMVNLSASMDPNRLAESAVDLNLKLMRWRLLPSLNLEAISATRCLLLGAGTLGCNVARCLLGWGVRNITLVDSGKVSYSNPVRQTLFTFEDSLNGGKPKAEAAAASLKQIFPGVNAVGLSLAIPMPGHTIVESEQEQTSHDVQQIEELISQHDAVFLLMDTRESRWLPTMIGAAYGKIVINSALGFDTYLVMRHGVKPSPSPEQTMDVQPPAGAEERAEGGAEGGRAEGGRAEGGVTSLRSSNISGHDLGCYFCNDVVAPGDSTRDRALDQQCTVSRPGMSYLASALSVELLASLITHPQQGAASAEVNPSDDVVLSPTDSPLGMVPHQLRGFLSRFQQVMPACRAFDKCTACSQIVIDSYRQEGFQFLLNVFNKPKYLEDLTGLTKLHMDTIDSEVWEMSDDESI